MCHREDVQALLRQYDCLMRENAIIQKENNVLTSKVAAHNTLVPPPCCINYGSDACECIPGSNISAEMQRMQNEIETIGSELQIIQEEREKLSRQQRLLLGCHHMPVCAPCISCAPGGPCSPGTMTCGTAMQILEMQEQIRHLADDTLSKKTEIDCLLDQQGELKREMDEVYKEMNTVRKKTTSLGDQLGKGERQFKRNAMSREQLVEQQQQISVFKQRYQQAMADITDANCCLKCQQVQLEEYRNLYLETQQMVEEQRRHIEIMELDNTRISDQVSIEIQRVKTQFQDKIIELSPLPCILKQTQNQLTTTNEEIRELEGQIAFLNQEISQTSSKLLEQESVVHSSQMSQNEESEEICELKDQGAEWEKKLEDLNEDMAKLKETMAETEETQLNAEQNLEEKCHEVAQLEGQLETLREESARQVARTKDRLEQTRRSLLCQIGEVERQLACARAAAKSATKDRDEIRERMQCQINNLQGNFDEAQTRIRILQQNVGLLSNSYSNIFNDISQPCPGFQALPMSCANSESVQTPTESCQTPRQEDGRLP